MSVQKSVIGWFQSLFFGSETQSGYSEEYIWLANQFGHFFIGFGGIFLLMWIYAFLTRREIPSFGYLRVAARSNVLSATPILSVAIVWATVWMGKEWGYDYMTAVEQSKVWVEPYTADLVKDTLTDSFFYIAGILVALAHFGVLFPVPPLVVLNISLAISVALGAYWLPQRRTLDLLNTPFFARLKDVNVKPVDDTSTLSTRDCNKTDYPLQFLMGLENCGRRHIIITALTKADLPKPGDTPEQVCIALLKVREALQELRRLGVALAVDRAVRSERHSAFYATFYQLAELRPFIDQALFVIDNTHLDLARDLKNGNNFLSDKINAANAKLQLDFNWLEVLNAPNTVWLSFDDELAEKLKVEISGNRASSVGIDILKVRVADSKITGCQAR